MTHETDNLASASSIGSRILEFLKVNIGSLLKFIAVVLILVGVWFGFLYLVDSKLPVEATPALVMAWLSGLALIVVLFPEALSKIKSLKVMDFEIELQDTVAEVSADEFIPVLDIENRQIFSAKGSLRTLHSLIQAAIVQPSRPVLLVVNLQNNISIPMLYEYLFFLDRVSANVVTLFISRENGRGISSGISAQAIVGAISGRKVLQTFQQLFPELPQRMQSGPVELRDLPSHRVLVDIYRNLADLFRQRYVSEDERLGERLSIDQVNNWFGRSLSSTSFELRKIDSDVENVRDTLKRGDEFMLIFENGDFSFVVFACDFARNVSEKALLSLQ